MRGGGGVRLACCTVLASMGLAAGGVAAEAAPAALLRSRSTSPSAHLLAPRPLQRAAAASASVYPTITFDDVPLGTYVTSEYESSGVVFTSTVKTEEDRANPTSPVLSGEPTFEGAIEGRFVDPATGLSQSIASFTLDVGYIDNRDSVVVEAFDSSGNVLQSVVAQDFGINTLTLTAKGMARFSVHEVANEPAGFAIDNLSVDPTGDPIAVTSVASMGDSYSSGEGLLLGKGTIYDCGTDLEAGLYFQDTTLPTLISRPWGPADCDTRTLTSTEPNLLQRLPPAYYDNGCHRDGLAYPVEIAAMLHASQSIFVACSGATTANIGAIPSTAKPQHPHSPVNVAGGNTQLTDVENFDQQRLGGGEPDLITIGVGGNDAGFASIAQDCIVTIFPCSSDQNFVDSVRNKITGPVYQALEETFEGLRADFPNSTIVAFGYPSPVSGDTPSCTGAPKQVDREYLDTVVLAELNQAVADAADAAGISYVDLSRVTVGHEVCSSEPWFRGLSYPIVQSFHPTQLAHEAITRYFRDHYTDGHGKLLLKNPPFAGNPITPVQFGVKGAIVDLSGGPLVPCGAGCQQAVPCIQSCSVTLQGSGYSPQAQLEAVLHSSPYDLGPVTADAEGNVEAIVQVPLGVAPGSHIITLNGTAPDGTPQYGSLGIDVLEGPASEQSRSSPTNTEAQSTQPPPSHGILSAKAKLVRARVTLLRRKLRLIATVACPRDAPSACLVTLNLRRTRRIKGHAHVVSLRKQTVRVPAGQSRNVTFRSSAVASARRQLAVLVTTVTRAGRLQQSLAVPK